MDSKPIFPSRKYPTPFAVHAEIYGVLVTVLTLLYAMVSKPRPGNSLPSPHAGLFQRTMRAYIPS